MEGTEHGVLCGACEVSCGETVMAGRMSMDGTDVRTDVGTTNLRRALR